MFTQHGRPTYLTSPEGMLARDPSIGPQAAPRRSPQRTVAAASVLPFSAYQRTTANTRCRTRCLDCILYMLWNMVVLSLLNCCAALFASPGLRGCLSMWQHVAGRLVVRCDYAVWVHRRRCARCAVVDVRHQTPVAPNDLYSGAAAVWMSYPCWFRSSIHFQSCPGARKLIGALVPQAQWHKARSPAAQRPQAYRH